MTGGNPKTGAPGWARQSWRSRFGWLALPLLALGIWQASTAFYLMGKAWLGQHLLDAAWERAAAGETDARPWPWADTWPVARLAAPDQQQDLVVLAGASGSTLAWAPGLLDGTGPVGEPGLAVVSAHRDTHFRFLEALAPGDALMVETPGRSPRAYTVLTTEIVDHRTARLPDPADSPWLTLATCYPFDAVAPGGPLRYLVHAAPAGSDR